MKKANSGKLFAFVLAIMICCAFFPINVQAEHSGESTILMDYSEEYLMNQAESVQLYNVLLDSFTQDTNSNNRMAHEIDTVYPDFYGGAYVDLETGGLTIKLTDLGAKQNLVDSVRFNKNITYKLCDVTLNELDSIANDINEKTTDYVEHGVIIEVTKVDPVLSKVIVEIQDLDESMIRYLTKDMPSEVVKRIEWHKAEGRAIHNAYGGGQTIMNPDRGSSSTIGFAAKKGVISGFVIAGHAGDVGDEIRCSGVLLGEITHNAYDYNTNADAAFVTAASGVSITNDLKTGQTIVDVETGRLPVGTVVYKYGMTTGWTNGRVTAQNVRVNYFNDDEEVYYYVSGCVETDYYSQRGDSGGPVVYSAGSNDQYILCGIHSGNRVGNEINENTGEYDVEASYYSPYANIVAALDITCYLGS